MNVEQNGEISDLSGSPNGLEKRSIWPRSQRAFWRRFSSLVQHRADNLWEKCVTGHVIPYRIMYGSDVKSVA